MSIHTKIKPTIAGIRKRHMLAIDMLTYPQLLTRLETGEFREMAATLRGIAKHIQDEAFLVEELWIKSITYRKVK